MDNLLSSVKTKNEANFNVIKLSVNISDRNGWMNGFDLRKIYSKQYISNEIAIY